MVVEQHYSCPHCWQSISVLLDASVSGIHRLVEDCEVCCAPAELKYRARDSRIEEFSAEAFQ